MGIEAIIKEIFRLKDESVKRKKEVKIEVLIGKSDIYYAHMAGLQIVNDDVVKMFDSFSGYESLRVLISFDGQGGGNEKIFALKG